MLLPRTYFARVFRGLQLWACACLATTAVVVVCIAADAALGWLPIDGAFVGTLGLAGPLTALALALIVVRRILGRPFARVDLAYLLAAISLVLANVVKSWAKYAGGRSWPKFDSPTFIHDQAYGFHPFFPPGT